ncbi:unnamed protein product, partial [Symbiodinium sp. CCMP2456]
MLSWASRELIERLSSSALYSSPANTLPDVFSLDEKQHHTCLKAAQLLTRTSEPTKIEDLTKLLQPLDILFGGVNIADEAYRSMKEVAFVHDVLAPIGLCCGSWPGVAHAVGSGFLAFIMQDVMAVCDGIGKLLIPLLAQKDKLNKLAESKTSGPG